MQARLTRRLWSIAQSARVIFLIALTLRLWVLRQLLPGKAFHYFYGYNEPSRIAWALVSGFGYSSPWPNTPLAPTAQQPPLYPFLIAAIFKMAGAYSYWSLWIAVGLNAVISSLSAVMILRLGKRDFGLAAGVLAAWIWSCWLYEAAVSVRLWESSLSALLLIAGLWLLPELAVTSRALLWLLFGLLAGVAALCNTTLLSVFLPFWIWLWLSHRRRGSSCGRWLLASVAVCLLVLTPWTIRNYRTFHQLMPIRDNFGMELWIGNHEGVTHQYPLDYPLLNPAEYNRLGEITFMETRGEIATQFIRQHPAQFLRLSLRRVFLFWTAPTGSAWPWISLLAWLGMVLAIRNKGWQAVPYAVVLLMFPLVYYITHSYDTYRHPIEPQILLLTSYAATAIAGPFLRRR